MKMGGHLERAFLYWTFWLPPGAVVVCGVACSEHAVIEIEAGLALVVDSRADR